MDVVHTSNKDDATIAVAGVIRNVKLGENLSEDQRSMLKDLTRKNPDVFTDMPGETDVIQHRVKLTEVDPEPMTMAEDLFLFSVASNTCPRSILANTRCTRGCVQNSVCDSRWTI